VIAPILVIISVIILAGVLVHLVHTTGEERRIWAIFLLLSWGDLITDILYVAQSTFRSEVVQGASLVFLVLPLLPGLYILRPQWSHIVKPYRYVLPFGDHAGNMIGVLANFVYNALKAVVYTLLLIGGIFVCLLLYATKLFTSVPFARRWFQVWNPEIVEGWSAVVVNHYHQSVLTELILETLPQITIQIYNNGSDWSTIAILSSTFSVFFIMNHIWKYAYFFFVERVPLKEVPVKLSFRRNKAAPEEAVAPGVQMTPSSKDDLTGWW